MRVLIRLELSKFKIKKYIFASIFITIGICLFTTISLFAIEQDNATDYTEAIKMINAAIIDCYLIFSALLIIRLIVEEYIKRTILILFTYSVNRQHLMIAKVILVLAITVTGMIITQIVSVNYLIIVSPYMKLGLNKFSYADFVYWLMQLGWAILLIIGFTLLNISVAFIKKTSQYVFLTSLFSIIIVQALVSQDLQNFSIILDVIFIIFTEISIKKYSDKIE